MIQKLGYANGAMTSRNISIVAESAVDSFASTISVGRKCLLRRMVVYVIPVMMRKKLSTPMNHRHLMVTVVAILGNLGGER